MNVIKKLKSRIPTGKVNDHLARTGLILTQVLIALVFYSFGYNIDSRSNKILGIYESPNKKSKVKFIRKDDKFYGKLIWNVNPQIKDHKNNSEDLKTLPLIGRNIFFDFIFNPYENTWVGKFYDAESGSTYDCNIYLENAGKRMMARGYLDHPLIGRTEALKRIK